MTITVIRKILDVGYLISIIGKEKVLDVNMLSKFNKPAQAQDSLDITATINKTNTLKKDSKDRHAIANVISSGRNPKYIAADIVEQVTVSQSSYKGAKMCPSTPSNYRTTIISSSM